MSEPFAFADTLGPDKVVEIYDTATGLEAVVVIDNVAAGPAIGGVRMASDVSTAECFRLARAMTLKNAMAGLAHGGGKSVIFADPSMPTDDKRSLIRSFARAIAQLTDYIPGPDMGTDETAMAWLRSVTGRAVGLPRDIGGIPLDEIGATAIGLVAAIDVARESIDMDLTNAAVVVEGFGSVGLHAARLLSERGARLVGASDSRGGIVNTNGLDVPALIDLKRQGRSVADLSQGERIDNDALIDVASDVFIPAARPDVIRADNVQRLNTRIVAQGANIPATPEAEKVLAERGVLVIPDFVANAGGVICAAVEYHQGSEAQARALITEKISTNVEEVLRAAREREVLPRLAAQEIAEARVRRAMSYRAA